MLQISNNVVIPDAELEFHFIRAQGPGGQNVNKVSTAVQLRFDVRSSQALPAFYKERLLRRSDHRITKDGVVIIRVQETRSQERNRELALQRLAELIRSVAVVQKKRIATKPTRGSQERRMDSKSKKGKTKALRGRVDY